MKFASRPPFCNSKQPTKKCFSLFIFFVQFHFYLYPAVLLVDREVIGSLHSTFLGIFFSLCCESQLENTALCTQIHTEGKRGNERNCDRMSTKVEIPLFWDPMF